MANISGNARIMDQIMDYYVRHGQNRDLERFLRLRASTTRSSSDGSLPGLEELDRREKLAEKMGKSMENLSTLRKEEQEKSRSGELRNLSGGSGKSDGGKDRSGDKEKKEESAPEVVVKDVKSEKKSGRNFNFNLESVIEIKLPQPPAVQPALMVSPRQAIQAPAPVIHEISTAGTQTMPEARSVEQQTEEPIRPVLKPSTLNPAEETIETTRDISPSSSVASAKQKLEWDSLGDIGYDSNEKFYFCGASDLNETEKRCLQKYFAKKGLNFDEKIVVVKNVPAKKVEQEEPKETPKASASKKWQNVYQKYKEKYPNPSEISLSLMNPDAQSTPKVVVSKELPPRPVKSTQTSLVRILTKGIQAEQSKDTTNKQVGTSPQKSLSSTSNKTPSVIEPTTDHADVADSFEFFSSPPSANESSNPVHQSSAGSTLKTSPEVTTSSTSSSSSHSATQQQQQSATSGGEYNFDDELRLGMTLYNTIYESRSLPARVKQSLIDKIFRKMVKNDPRGRTKQQLLEYCEQLKRGGEGGRESISGVEEVASSAGSSRGEGVKTPDERAESAGVEEVVEQVEPLVVNEEKEDPIVQNFQELSIKSNEARNPAISLTSSQPTLSSSRQDSSKGTARHRSQISLPTKSSQSDGVQTSDERIRKAMTDYLRPMTRSEVDYANQQDLKRSLERAKERKSNSAPTTTGSSGDRIFALFQKEKQSQLLKVDKKIEHLKAIKLLLLEEQKAVREIQGDTSTTVPVQDKFRKPLASPEEKENIYENTQRRTRSAASAPVYTSVHGDTPSGSTKNETEYSTESESAWNSHYHLKKMIQNRSKLETPTSDESIATFIKARKDKFIENYERHRKRSMLDDQQHLYMKPYSGRQSKQDHYSRLDEKYSVRKLVKPPMDRVNLPSSDVFISSDSMSIPAANTLTNTTTHQYDIKSTRSSPESLVTNAKAAGTQTTGSILRTKPIFETKPPKTTTAVQVPSATGCHCSCNCPCRHRNTQQQPVTTQKHTEIIDGTHPKQDKQQQTKPSSIAYVITFQGDPKSPTERRNRRNPDPEKDQVYRTSSTDTSSPGTDSKTNAVDEEDPDQYELLPLKEQFKRNRPTTLSRLKERQKCVNELHKLRSERNKQRKKLLLLTSDDSLRRCDVKQRLPPPPLAQTRIFSSKAIRENTRRQVKNLPEVLRKKEIEKVNNLKRKNLILREKFNKNLQRKVLHGHVDLSNSVRVMQD